MTHQDGAFIWLMGLAGVGKSTIAECFTNNLRARFKEALWLDGDELRKALNIQGHTREERLDAGLKYLNLARLLVNQCNFVVLSSIGLQKPFEDFAKSNFTRYFQVLIDGDVESISNQRNFYVKGTKDVMGVDLIPDQLNFDFVVRNDRSESVGDLVFQLETGFDRWLTS